jgi:glycosyltransferase involved in cell wall biosynthesis
MTSGGQPLVSVITPVLNREEMIGRCLTSVAKQSHPRVEHIVVDGGSTDGTLDIVRSFERSHPIRWISGPDEGMYDAINKGLNLARGDVLAYVNSDDLYLPWSLEVAARSLSRGSDIVYGDLAVTAERRVGRRFFIQYYPPFDRTHFTYEAALGQPSVFWTRSVIDRIGLFDASYELIGDCEYWLRAARSGLTLHHVKEVLAVQVEHGDTLRIRFPELLDQEWKTLRHTYAAWAGPPRASWKGALAASVSWRTNQLRFIAAAHRSEPKAWPMFLAWLRDHGIDVPTSGLFWYCLPGRRGMRPPMVDMPPLERALEALAS